jgi:hypothetical protein
MEELKKTTKSLDQDNKSSGLDPKRIPPDYEAGIALNWN